MPYSIDFCIFETRMKQHLQHNLRTGCFLTFWLGCMALLWAFDPTVYLQIRGQISGGDVEGGIRQIEKQIKKDKKEAEWYWLLDDVYQSQNNTEARIFYLQRALSVKKLSEREATLFRLGQAYFDAGMYDKAQEIYAIMPPSRIQQRAIKACAIADSLRNNPVDIQRNSMGDSINLPYDNIWPSLTADGTYFCSTVVIGKRGFVGNTLQLQEDIYSCSKKGGVWQPIEALPYPINTEANEGSPCFSADGKYLFFVRCGEHSGMGSCDIYYCINRKGKWSKPILAPAPLNSKYWESTPCMSASGKEMYFASNRPGGKGKKDIWRCQITRNSDGTLQFDNVVVLGGNINTPYDEISPFLHANDSTLYFSSNGHYGLGRLDIFCCNRLGENQWSEPTNLGYPINTHSDEMGWIVSPDGETAYMASDSSLTGVSHKIIYQINLPLALQPAPSTPQQLWDIQKTVTLRHIYFDFDKATLQPTSEKELNLLVELIQNNPNKTFIVTGHTDNVGNDAYNQTLSEKRAESVVQYLIEKGIDSKRLVSQGMGSSQPTETNATEWGRSQNRRIEVSVQ